MQRPVLLVLCLGLLPLALCFAPSFTPALRQVIVKNRLIRHFHKNFVGVDSQEHLSGLRVRVPGGRIERLVGGGGDDSHAELKWASRGREREVARV